MSQPKQPVFPSLLFQEICLLAFLSGVLVERFYVQGIVALFLVWVGSRLRTQKVATCFFILMCFASGFLYAEYRGVQKPIEPKWLVQAFGTDDAITRPEKIYVTGTIVQVQELASGSARLLVKDFVPATDSFAPAYTGQVSVTLRQVKTLPFAGQTVTGNFRFAKVRGFANPGVFSIEKYWHDKKVWVRGWEATARNISSLEISGSPNVFAQIREKLRQRFLSALPIQAGQEIASLAGTGTAFLPALIFDDRSLITQYQLDIMAKSTLTHSLSLSGLHLGYVATVAIVLAQLVSWIRPAVLLRISRPRLIMLLTVPFVCIYLWIGGAPVSLIRSALMFFFACIFLLCNRTRVVLDGLLAAVGLIVVYNPASLFDLSLQLSAVSVAVIALFLPLLQKVSLFIFSKKQQKNASPRRSHGSTTSKNQQKIVPLWQEYCRGGLILLGLSFTIQVVVSPLVLNAFGVVGIWFPLNLIWLPVLGILVMPLAFVAFGCVTLGFDTIAQYALAGAAVPCRWLMSALTAMDEAGILVSPAAMRPHWTVSVGFWLCCLMLPILYTQWRKTQKNTHAKKDTNRVKKYVQENQKLILFLSVGFFVVACNYSYLWYRYSHQPVSISMLDVGQGQSLVVSWAGGRAIIDGGGFSSPDFDVGRMVIGPALTYQKPAKVSWFINTHPDYDHLGGLLWPLANIATQHGFARNHEAPTGQMGELFIALMAKNDIPVHIWKAGDRIALTNDLWLEVLSPAGDDSAKGNDASLILRLVWQGRGLAIMFGDASGKVIRQVLADQSKDVTAEVLILPHHGSGTGYLPELYDRVNPTYAWASCGYKNAWRFPAKKIREALGQRKIPLYTTGEHGWTEVVWKTQGGQPELRYFRQ